MKTQEQSAKDLSKKLRIQLRDVLSRPLEGLWEDVKLTGRDMGQAKKWAVR